MAIDLQNPTNIATGWGRPPDFSAPNIGGMVGDILKTRLLREEQQQKQIADAIKNIQSQREEAAYVDAAQRAGLLPEGDTGYGGKYGSELARQIQAKRVADSLIARRAQLEAATGRGRGGGGGSAEPQTYWDEQGREWRPGPGGRWIPMKSPNAQTPGGTPKLSPTEKGWAAPEIPGVSVDIHAPDEPGTTLQPDVPPAPDAAPTAPPSDQVGGHAADYGVKATYMKAPDGTVSPVDPNLVEYYKSKGAVIVQGP